MRVTDVAIYVLWNGGNSFYVGFTRDYPTRIKAHQTGKGSWVTKAWWRNRRPCIPYWKISIPVEFAHMEQKLVDFENLVQQTLQRQNPQYMIHGGIRPVKDAGL